MKALGGKQAWDNTHYLHFTFAGRRTHWWDKWNGRYRVEGQNKEGKKYVVLENINTKEGTAYLDGQKVEGDQAKQLLEAGYGAWVNDTYWLLMPYKMKDPGVVLAYEGEEKGGEAVWDKLALRFDNVGLTPKDRYWVYVNRATHLVDRWDYILNGEAGPATTWMWTGWQRYGKVMLAPERENSQKKTRIYFPVLQAPESVGEAVFAAP